MVTYQQLMQAIKRPTHRGPMAVAYRLRMTGLVLSPISSYGPFVNPIVAGLDDAAALLPRNWSAAQKLYKPAANGHFARDSLFAGMYFGFVGVQLAARLGKSS